MPIFMTTATMAIGSGVCVERHARSDKHPLRILDIRIASLVVAAHQDLAPGRRSGCIDLRSRIQRDPLAQYTYVTTGTRQAPGRHLALDPGCTLFTEDHDLATGSAVGSRDAVCSQHHIVAT